MTDREEVEKLQKQVLHLEDTIHQLDGVVIDQQKQIDDLKQMVTRLVQEHMQLKEELVPEIPDAPPPHY